MKRILLTVALPLTMALVGCETTGLSTREQSGQYATLVTTLYQNEPSAARGPVALRVPAHIAVAQIGEVTPSKILLERLEQERGLISQISPLPFPGEKQRPYSSARKETSSDELGKQATGLRNLARDMGAEYLLIAGGNIDSYETRKAASVLDWTIVGAAVVPGTRITSEGKGAAALLDVETGRVIFLVNSELNKSSLSPSLYTDSKRTELNLQLRDELLGKLSEEFLRRLQAATAARR